jgi:hypothetical protein
MALRACMARRACVALRASMALMAREGDMRGTQKALEGKHDEERSLGKPTGTQDDNIKLDL